MVVWFAIHANKAEDSRVFEANKQAVEAHSFGQFGILLAGLCPMIARYALMNQGTEAVDQDLFARAFRGVPGLTPMDANLVGHADCGMLVRNVTFEQAAALQANLKATGTESERQINNRGALRICILFEQGRFPQRPGLAAFTCYCPNRPTLLITPGTASKNSERQ